MAQTAVATKIALPTNPIEDASLRGSSAKLDNQAATAALYAHNRDSSTKNGYEFLDSDYKLSSAGAAASLKYANPQDLPSFPSSGLKNGDSAAGAAASLGWSNQKTFQHWKPDPSNHASAAAMLAKDYKVAPAWQPEQSANGAKAALLAHKDAGKVEIWRPEATAWGNSAANQAFQKDRAGTLSPRLDYGHTDLGRKGSLLAATGAMATSRRRAESSPMAPAKVETYPDEANASHNALSAAKSSASRSTRRVGASEGGAVPYTNMTRDMYTSHPPVALEVEEQNRKDTLRASSIAMAKQLYNIQQKQMDAAAGAGAQQGAVAATKRRPSSTSGEEVQPMRFTNLQEAAQKLAQERLAKLHDEHAKNRDYRDYYSGSSNAVLTAPPSRLSIRGRTRHRSGSDGVFDEDREQSNKIRAQMSLFSSSLSQVDEKKRQADREALIAAAQRNVTKSLHSMDEKVFADTGKVAPSLLDEWELKAHAAAQAKSDNRMENYGKVDIGGGRFISQSAVDLVAKKNVQPVLDEINEKAEKERERQAAVKLDQENQKRNDAEKKALEKEEKDINKKLKREEKDERKAQAVEEKRLAKEKRKSVKLGAAAPAIEEPSTEATEPIEEPAHEISQAATETIVEPASVALPGSVAEPIKESAEPAPKTVPETRSIGEPAKSVPDTLPEAVTEPVKEQPTKSVTPAAKPAPTTIADRREISSAPDHIRTSMEDQASLRMQENADAANGDIVTLMSPNSPGGGRVKKWLKTKFSRRMSKSQKSPGLTGEKEGDAPLADKGFVGGAALTGASANNSTTSLGRRTSPTREREVSVTRAMQENAEARGRGNTRDSDEVSALSEPNGNGEENEEFQEARDNFDEALAPPPTFVAVKSSSPARETRFQEDI